MPLFDAAQMAAMRALEADLKKAQAGILALLNSVPSGKNDRHPAFRFAVEIKDGVDGAIAGITRVENTNNDDFGRRTPIKEESGPPRTPRGNGPTERG